MKTNLKKIIACLMAVIMVMSIMPVTVFAAEIVESGQCGDNVYWTLDDEGTLTIYGEGAMWDYYCYVADFGDDYSPFTNNSQIKTAIIDSGITNIGAGVFYGCYNLISVIVSNSVTSIGAGAFENCSNLENITIPDSVTTIGYSAFESCSRLENITIPNSVTTIGLEAFYDTALYNNQDNWEDDYVLYINKCLIKAKQSISGDYAIKDGTRLIAGDAFRYCNNLTNATIPDSVTSINSSAFADCGQLRSVTISNSVTRIEKYTFAWCECLDTIIIGDSIITIDNYAFYDCGKITDVYYTGSDDQWNQIEIGDYNDCLKNVIIHFNYVPCNHLDTEEYPEQVATCTEDGYTAGVYCHDCEKWISGHKVTKAHHTDENGDGICDICNEATELSIKTGETLTIDIVGGEITFIRFVPEVSGRYTFESLSDDDTYGYLYDANKEEITDDDDSGNGLNFSISYDFKAGTTYYFGAEFLSGDSGSFDVRLTLDEIACEHINTESYPEQNATCTETGYTAGIYCTDCERWISGHEIIKAHHTDNDRDGICDICKEDAVEKGQCGDNVYWTLDAEGTLTISGEGAMWDYNDWNNFSPFYDSAMIKSVVIKNGVTTIGDYAFFSCNLANITISNSVITIGEYAFGHCNNLTNLTIPDSVITIDWGAFYDCDNLENVTISDSVINIDGYAFARCEKLISIKIPNGVTSIGIYTFENCSNLRNLTIGSSVNSIEYSAFENCYNLTSVKIPDSVTSIENSVFKGCSNLANITIPDTVTSIGHDAFLDTLYYNNSANWENGVLYIGNHLIKANPDIISGAYEIKSGTKSVAASAYEECVNLTSVIIPDSVTGINYSTFSGCSNLTSLVIPESVTYIDSYAFSWCESLVNIPIPDSVKKIGHDAFEGTAYYNDYSNWENGVLYIGNHLVAADYLTVSGEYKIKEGTKCIAAGAFDLFDSLTSIEIPDSITIIDDLTFNGCKSLKSVRLSNNLVEISRWAFMYCENLEDVIIPSTVVKIGDYAFSATAMKEAIIPRSVLSIGKNAFGYVYGTGMADFPEIKLDDYVIKGYKGTAAETYAIENGFKFIEIDDHTHFYTTEITIPATCTENGVMTYTCSCEDSYTEVILATGHIDNNDDGVCDNCGEILRQETPKLTFIQRIQNFFKRIFDLVRNLFK